MDMTLQAAALAFEKSDDFLILTHRRPDGDTIGCAVRNDFVKHFNIVFYK